MIKSKSICSAPVMALGVLVLSNIAAFGQAQAGSPTAAPLITQPVSSQARTLTGHVRPGLAALPDLGAVSDSQPFDLYMVLQRSPAQQADLQYLIARQQEPTAAEYHQWLTPQQFGQRFGAAKQDIAAITTWLQAQGLQVNGVMNNASVIDFSATAAQIRQVFGSQIHNFSINGGTFPAAVNEPSVPAALAPAVASIFGLTKIPAHTNVHNPTQVSYNAATHSWNDPPSTSTAPLSPAYSRGGGNYWVAPQDLYTIYNVNKVLSPTGLNDLAATSTVAVIEESDIEFGTVNGTTGAATGGDVATFRTLFGVPGTLNMHVYHGYGSVACNAPGIDPSGIGEEVEAALDAEWANATAPSANLIFMSCDDSTHSGIFSSLAAVIDNNLADVMSMSYGESENFANSSLYSLLDSLYSQAATQGQSVLVSSGDSGSDVEDQNTNGSATSGINVSAFSASPLVTATGGTDFSDTYDYLKGGSPQSTYWGAVNSANYSDALSYVPETTWNDSCANSLLTNYYGYSGLGLCALGEFINGDVVGGSGGFSTHYSVPAYQSGILGYAGTQRAQPDIAGFASSGFWGHALLFCDSYRSSIACASSSTFGAAGGTSFVAPYMAGVAALLDTYTGSRQGLLNPALYALAKTQFTSPSTSTACYANGQTSNTSVTTGLPASICTFNDVTTSNNDVGCAAGALNCYVYPSASYGALSLTGTSSLSIAFPSTPGYDETTGLGSVNIYNLLSNWTNAFTSSVSLQATVTSVSPGGSTNLEATVTGGVPAGYSGVDPAVTGTVSFYDGTNLIGNCILSAGYCSASISATSLQPGSNSITAKYLGNGTYPSSTSTIQTVILTLTPQTITFGTISQQTVGTPLTLTATASSGLQVSYSATPSTVCSVSGSTASFAGPGQCSITASQAGNSTYAAATPVTQTFTVLTALTPQTITFGPISQQTVGTPLALTATASSGLTVNYSATPSTVCSVSGSTASFAGPGQCSITASQAGNSTYAAASPVTQTFTVATAPLTPQTITFGSISQQTVGTPLTLTATASSGLTVSYSATPSTVCSVSGSTASFVGAGQCSITASQAGNSTYAAATPVTQTFTVVLTPQTITFGTISQQTVGTPLTLTATASSNLTVSYSAIPSTVCSVSGSTASFVGAGQCSITASQAGNSTYAAATPVTQTFTVILTPQTITFGTISQQTVGTPLTLTATASSGLQVSYSATPSTVCSVSGSTASFAGAGQCSITASQAGNSTYAAATPVTQTFTVATAPLTPQTITFGTISQQTVGTPLTLTATASSGLTVSYSATPSTVCSVSGSTASFVGAGQCSITASQAGNSTYAAATPVTQTFTVVLTPQTITFGTISQQTVGTPLILTATASSNLTVSYSATPSTVCSVSGSTASFAGAGQCSITASQAGNSTYAAATPVTRTFTVVAAPLTPQTITFGTISQQTVGTPLTLTATASSGLTVSYSATPSTVCSVSGSTASFAGAGQCSITASQAGNSTYAAATPVTQTFTVVAAPLTPQTITFGPISQQTVGTPLTLTATASSNLPVSYSATPSQVCSVTGSTASFIGTGQCSITASQAGNSTYAPATPVTQTFTVVGSTYGAPVISNIQAVSVGGNSEVITWNTDQASTSLVNYGPTSAYGSASTPQTALVTFHSVTLTGLLQNTTYDFDVVSANSQSAATTSTNSTFTTTPYVGYLAFWGVNNSGVTISWSTDIASNTSVAYGTTMALGSLSPLQSTLTNSHGAVLTGLSSGTTYYFQALSTTAAGSTGGSAIYSFTTTGVSASPAPIISNVSVSSITSTSAVIRWTTDQASSSQVNYGTTTGYGSSSPLNSSLVTSHTMTLTGLTPGTTYDFDVVSVNSSGTSSGMSSNSTFTTSAAAAPPTISNIQTTALTSTSVTITWTTDQASNSEVNYGATTAYGYTNGPDNNYVTSHSVTLTGLTAGATYDFDVVSRNTGGLFSTSPNSSFTTTAANATPPSVGYVAFWGINNSGVTVSWSTDVLATTQLAYGTTTALGQLTPLQSALTASHGVVLTGLNSGTTYYFVAQSTGANGATGYSTTYTFTTTGTPSGAPPVITNVAAGSPTNTSVTITWTTDQASSSQVNYGPTSSYTSSTTLNSALVTSHTVVVTGLSPGTTYHFDVMSANSSNVSATSPDSTFATTGTSPGPVITAVAASSVTSGTAMITWTTDQASTSLVNYGTNVSYGSSSAPSSTLVTSHSVMLSGLTPSTTYNFDVVSANSASTATTSGNYTFTTLGATAAPPVISNVAFWGVTSSGITISWSTNVAANTSVAYGTTTSLGQLSPVQTALANSHGVVLTGLNPGATYYFVAQSADVDGNTGYSTTYTFTTIAGPPSISNVIVTPAANNTATISWTTSAPTYSYVQYGLTSGNYIRYSAQTSLTGAPRCTLSFVPSGTVYYQLVSIDAFGNKTVSPEATFAEP